jgi:acyl-CoA synthetase (AMP-forming)/AMP-acid ligase II
VHTGTATYSRAEVRARAEGLAAAVLGAGILPGRPVGVMLPNGPDVIAAWFGVWQAGGVVVPLNGRATDSEAGRIAREVGLAAVVTSVDQLQRVGAGSAYDPAVAIVSFTSGTTGAPKPVPLRHDRVIEGLDQVLGTLRRGPGRPEAGLSRPEAGPGRPGGDPPMPNLIPVSLSLWAGIYQVLFAFRVGAPVVVMEGFATREFAAVVRRFAIRSTVLPPAAMVMLTDDPAIDDLAPLKYVRSISAPLSPLQARRFRDRFGISVLNGYGQTELGGEVVGWSAADTRTFGDDKLGAVGRPHSGVDVRTDERGELLVRIPGRIDEWQHTGDVARIDEDGFVWIEGRLSDMINRGGLKVHPAEVEEVIRLSPAVADAAVVGVPDERLGEVPVAFVVEAAPVTDTALEALCRQHLTPYKVPVSFRRVGALPRNEAGKVMKRALDLSARES